MAFGKEINYIRSLEFEKQGMIESHGIQLGFQFHRGEMPDNENYKPTLKVVLCQMDHEGRFAAIKKINRKEPGQANIDQIVLPDNLESLKALGEFCLGAYESAQELVKAELKAVQQKAKEAGIKA